MSDDTDADADFIGPTGPKAVVYTYRDYEVGPTKVWVDPETGFQNIKTTIILRGQMAIDYLAWRKENGYE